MKRKIAVVLVMSLVAGVSVLGCSSGSGSSAERITIKAAMGGGMKPYAFVGADDEPTEYDIEVLKEVFNRLPQYNLTILLPIR